MQPAAFSDLVEQLRLSGEQSGLVGFGVCTVEPFAEVRAEMSRRLETGLAGRPRFTYTDPETATDPIRSFDWAKRLVVGGVTYLPAAGAPGPSRPNSGRIARFATSDHYRPLRVALASIADELRVSGFRAEVLADDSRLVDRAAAVRAGVAWWGRSTMALAPRYGPWLLLGSVVTDAPLPVSEPMVRTCGTCIACIPACPTGALDTEGVLDATLCISYWAQTPGFIPPPIRESWGDRVYGCDDCLDACPPGAALTREASAEAGRVDLLDFLDLSDEELLTAYAHFYVPRRDARFLRRNALVALGHSADPTALSVLSRYLASPDPILRAHAGWALGRLGGPAAVALLANALVVEADLEVRRELQAAVDRTDAT